MTRCAMGLLLLGLPGSVWGAGSPVPTRVETLARQVCRGPDAFESEFRVMQYEHPLRDRPGEREPQESRLRILALETGSSDDCSVRRSWQRMAGTVSEAWFPRGSTSRALVCGAEDESGLLVSVWSGNCGSVAIEIRRVDLVSRVATRYPTGSMLRGKGPDPAFEEPPLGTLRMELGADRCGVGQVEARRDGEQLVLTLRGWDGCCPQDPVVFDLRRRKFVVVPSDWRLP